MARVSLIKERTTMFKWSLFVDIEGFSQMFLSGRKIFAVLFDEKVR